MGRIRGFTLIELMVTLAVFAIVAGLAIPSFTQMIRDNRSVALADNLLSAAQYARAQAVTVKGAVSLCASADGATCGEIGRASCRERVEISEVDDLIE